MTLLEALDDKRVTEEGAEAVALVYANATGGLGSEAQAPADGRRGLAAEQGKTMAGA
jgi:hypothetical protein